MTTRTGFLGAIIALVVGCASAQAELRAPAGPVILTVVGDIAHSNRGAMDPAVDRLLHYHEQEFETAAAFDLSMLEALGMQTRRVALSFQPEVQEIEGPPLAAVLEAVGAGSGRLTVLALDGYQVEIDAASRAAHDWILGVRRNGRDLGIGDLGPAWLVFSPTAADGYATPEEADMWPYETFFIRVETE